MGKYQVRLRRLTPHPKRPAPSPLAFWAAAVRPSWRPTRAAAHSKPPARFGPDRCRAQSQQHQATLRPLHPCPALLASVTSALAIPEKRHPKTSAHSHGRMSHGYIPSRHTSLSGLSAARAQTRRLEVGGWVNARCAAASGELENRHRVRLLTADAGSPGSHFTPMVMT